MSAKLPEPLALPWQFKPVSSAQSGCDTLADGRRVFWVKEELKGITPKMLVWWFSHLEGDITIGGRQLSRYRVFHPLDHVSARYVRRLPDGSIGPGAQISIVEYLDRNPRFKFDGVATIDKLDEEGFINHVDRYGIPLARLDHTFQQTSTGTHFEHFLMVPASSHISPFGRAVVKLGFSQTEGEAWLKHAIEEMGSLENFLPELYDHETTMRTPVYSPIPAVSP